MKWLVLAILLLAGCASPSTHVGNASTGELTCNPCDVVLTTERYAFEPSGAINPTDSNHYAVAFRSDSNATEVHFTKDGGRTWAVTHLPLGDYTHMGDPVAVFSPEGILHVANLGATNTDVGGLANHAEGRDIIVSTSTDGGETFGLPKLVFAGGGTKTTAPELSISNDFANQDREWIAVGHDGRMIVIWNDLGTSGLYGNVAGSQIGEYDGNVIRISTSNDHGATWTLQQTYEWNGSPDVIVLEDGTFVAAINNYQGTQLRVGRSTDGSSWEWEDVGKAYGQPALAEWSQGLVVGSNTAHAGGSAPAYWIYNGTWAGPQIIENGAAGVAHPTIAIHHDTLWMSWYGRETSDYRLAKVPLQDGVWPTERFVVATNVDPTTANYGHYVDTLAAGDKIYVAWNQLDDTRNVHVSVYS